VDFDMYGTGRLLRVAWPTSAGTAWLALDRNHNGRVDDGTELFGNTRWLVSGNAPRHGYDVLAEFDNNQDDVIDSVDPVFGQLLLWEDRNRNGRSEPGELTGLVEAGIIALELNAREAGRVDKWGNQFRYRAKVHAASSPNSRFSWDVVLKTLRSSTQTTSCRPGHTPAPRDVASREGD
jgi:hypothetical protein